MPEEERCRVRGIHFLRVGAFPPANAQELVARVSRHVHVPCRLLASAFTTGVPLLDGRPQVSADALLARLEGQAGEPGTILFGLVDEDIGSPLFTFHFGRARVRGRAAIVSVARLRPQFYGFAADPGLTVQRTEREILHELGHVAGLHHCDDYRCLMYFASSVHAIDLRDPSFCAACAAALPDWLAHVESPT
ncbi:MAG: hypothetical protein ACYTEZ_12555 [Planctomycetota bacterium]|jgi:predicted Zn-dependent protease